MAKRKSKPRVAPIAPEKSGQRGAAREPAAADAPVPAAETVGRPTVVIPRMTARQAAFVRAYLELGNATAAYTRAGYKDTPAAAAHASRLLQHPAAAVAAVESRAAARSAATVQRLELELERIALQDPRQRYRPDGSLKAPGEWDDATAAAIMSVEVDELFEGRGDERELIGHVKKVKGWDKVRALLELLRRRDQAGRPAPAAPGATPEKPLHVSLSLTQRIAELESAFVGAARHAGESPVPGDGDREPVDPGSHQGRAHGQAG